MACVESDRCAQVRSHVVEQVNYFHHRRFCNVCLFAVVIIQGDKDGIVDC